MMFSDTAVILCAGRGTRMNSEIPKVLLPIAGQPILGRIVSFWQEQGIKEFVFVVGYHANEVLTYIDSLNIDHWTYVVQKEQKGIANAIYEPMLALIDCQKFVVQLGDIIQIGSYNYPEGLDIGYGIWDNPYDHYRNIGCSVSVNWKGDITGVKEKVDVEFAGMGTYFLNQSVFKYIEKTKPSKLRDEVEISDVLNTMVKDGCKLKAVPFEGEVLNITSPDDLTYAEKLLSLGK